MENKVLKEQVEGLATQVNGEVEESFGVFTLRVKALDIIKTLTAAKNFKNIPCDFLHDLCGLDLVDHFEVVYQLSSGFLLSSRINLRSVLDHENNKTKVYYHQNRVTYWKS